MAAYWVATYSAIHDDTKLAAYAALATAAIEAAGGKFIARGMPETVYENGQMQRVVVIEFPSIEAATACHDSPGYQAALAALDGAADREIRVVDGV